MPDSLADARGHRPRKTSRAPATYQDTDACGTAPRKTPRSALPGVDADACGTAPRMTPRSAVPGVAADARGTAPRKTPRPVGRGRRPRGRRPNRRRSLNYVRPSLPRLSPDSTGIDGEIALLRSLTNRLLSTRPLDYTQVNRCLRLIIRAFSAQAKAPKQLTDQEQIDNLIKKVFQDNIDKGDLDFRDLIPVRMARPGDKWWPWRMLLPLEDRWRYGLIDPDEPWPHEENEKLAEAQELERIVSEAYLKLDELFHDDDPDDEDDDYDPDPDDDEDPPLYNPPYDDDDPSPVGVPLVGALDATHPDTGPSPDWADPNPPPRIARGRPPPLPPDHSNAPRGI